MSKINEFLTELEQELIYLKPKDAGDVLKFYRDKINIAMDYEADEDKIIASFQSPKKIAEDIYKSKGTDYLNKRKKQFKKTSKLKAILSGLLVVAIILFLFSITVFAFSSIVQLFKLFGLSFKMDDIIDMVTLDLAILSYVFILVVIYVYFFDLMYIIVSHFIYPFLYEFVNKDKEYKFLSFTISGLVEKILNKKGILGKVLLVLFVALFVFGVSNFVTNGYISRSMNDEVSLIEEVIVENDVTEIKINESTTFVKVFYSDVENITLKYYNEFNNKLEYNNENGVFTIDSINQKVFDLFGLLDEPLSKIEIVLPINNNLNKLDLRLNGGYFDIVDYNGSLTLDIKGSSSTYAITRSTFSSLVVDGYNLSIACEENNIANVNLKLKDGKSYFMNNTVNEFFVENHLADLVIQDANIETLNITNTSARAALDKINANTITYKDQNSESLLQYVYSNNMKVSSLGNSDITLDKVIVEDTIALDNSAGSFDLRYIKAKNISTEFKSGNVEMYYINRNVTNASDEFLIKYNEFSVDSTISFVTYQTKITITSSTFDNVSCNFKYGSIKANASYFENTDMYFEETNINLIDVDGVKMNVKVNGGTFSIDDETITTKIVVCISGELIKTDIFISETITRGEACEE